MRLFYLYVYTQVELQIYNTYAKTIFYIKIIMKKRHELDLGRLLGVIYWEFE